MKYKEIVKILNRLAPEELACEWDNVGLLVGSSEKDINNIYITVDLTDEILEEAIKFGADMIISHHPLIFNGLKRITDENIISRRVLELIKHDIVYYAMHTNFDTAPLGMGNVVADKLGLISSEPITDKKEYEGMLCGIGRIGMIEKQISLAEFIENIKESLGIDKVTVYSNQSECNVKTVAILPGSGRSQIGTVIAMGADVYVTGDITHHEGIDAAAEGLTIIDAGHYGMEYGFCNYLNKYLKLSLSDTVTIKIETYKNPMQIR